MTNLTGKVMRNICTVIPSDPQERGVPMRAADSSGSVAGRGLKRCYIRTACAAAEMAPCRLRRPEAVPHQDRH